MSNEITIPTYIINMPNQTDRLAHIQSQFRNKKEFDIRIIEGSENVIGAVGHWASICRIINMAMERDEDVIILCEDDHEFTAHYDAETFISTIYEAHRLGANLLLGGISGGLTNVLPLPSRLFWLDTFCGTQFLVVYSSFYKTILEELFSEKDVADAKFSEMTSNKFVIHPMISVQKDFGYSDITRANNLDGHLDDLFHSVTVRMEKIYEVYQQHMTK
jgi:hypothetical protein